MKRSIVVVIAVAILGLMAFYKDRGASSLSLVPRTVGAATAATAGSASQTSGYKNGTFTGSTAYIPYGPVQVAVVISGGKITDVQFLQMPSDQGYSRQVAAAAEPLLKQSTLQAQSANIDFVSGATATSSGYQQSLQSALDQAAAGGSTSQSGAPSTSSPGAAGQTQFQPSNLPANYDN